MLHARLPAAILAAALSPVPGAGQEAAAPDTVVWREFDRATFGEAARTGKGVFLVSTAPWNRDHFLLRTRYFADPDVVLHLNRDYLPIHVDVSVYPELRELYSLRSGLVPSFHFVDAQGRAHATFPPLEAEELVYFLDDLKDLRDVPAEPVPARLAPGAGGDGKLADRIAGLLLEQFASGGSVAVHRDLDPSALSFLVEYGTTRPDRRDVLQTIDGELRRLLASEMYDDVDGGFHRAPATPDLRTIHREKLLRQNAEIGAVLASWHRMAGDEAFARAALQTLQFFNRRMKKRDPTLYGGSMAADVYDPGEDRVRMRGEEYYALDAALRSRVGVPPVSRKMPVGGNFVLQQALVSYLRAFRDERMTQPARWSGDFLLASGFEEKGLALRSLGLPGTGCLRDQGDAGSGLLAVHAVAGNARALEAAIRLADALVAQFWDAERSVFLNVDRDGDLPDFVREAEPVAAWNGTVLRFLADLAAATRADRLRKLVESSLAAWDGRLPPDGRGIGELGRAALRTEAALPVLVVAAEPESEEGRRLRDLAFLLYDPLAVVRWVAPEDRAAAHWLGVDLEAGPAIHVVWDRVSRPVGDAVLLRAVYEDARERVRGK
jgi:uncharacterized protein YyaL (SSP411 family)